MSSDKFLNINLKNLLKRSDFYNYFRKYHYDTKEERKELLNNLVSDIDLLDYKFEYINKAVVKDKDIYYIKKPKTIDRENIPLKLMQEDFLIRIISAYIGNVYKVKQADRFKIIKVIVNILSAKSPFKMIKCDIKHFYENINVEKLFKKVNKSVLIPFEIKTLLQRIYDTININNTVSGLPRGLSISAILSELYMENFDQEIKQMDGVFFYARYVDDIIIFTTKNKLLIKEQVEKKLKEIGLELNDKTEDDEKNFTYLGYHFKKDNELVISISDNKINKIKRKIVLSFLDYKKNQNADLLLKRLKFLSTNYPINLFNHVIKENNSNKYLYAGLSYNYSLINDLSCIKKLDNFIQIVLHQPHFIKIQRVIDQNNLREKIKKISFYKNFVLRKKSKYHLEEINEIIKCWRYDG